MQPGHSTRRSVTKALIAEFERLKTEPITEHELQRAKNQFARDYILGRESNQQKAMQLAHAVVIHHDIKTADGEFDIFQNITVADVQRVARTYFTSGESPGAHAAAVGQGRRAMRTTLASRGSWFAVRRLLGLLLGLRGVSEAQTRNWPSRRRRGRCRRATPSSRPTTFKRCPTACRSSWCCITSSRR